VVEHDEGWRGDQGKIGIKPDGRRIEIGVFLYVSVSLWEKEEKGHIPGFLSGFLLEGMEWTDGWSIVLT